MRVRVRFPSNGPVVPVCLNECQDVTTEEKEEPRDTQQYHNLGMTRQQDGMEGRKSEQRYWHTCMERRCRIVREKTGESGVQVVAHRGVYGVSLNQVAETNKCRCQV